MVSRTLDHLAELGYPKSAVEYVRSALESEPSRVAGQFAKGNVAGNYSSPTQGFSVQSESHGAELTYILRWEYSTDVLLYVDQPPPVELYKRDKNGVLKRSIYTPDFLVVEQGGVLIVEVKRESDLLKNAEKYPEQWVCDNGEWEYVPAHEHFDSIGLPHVVLNASSLSRVRTSNLKALIRVAVEGVEVGSDLRAAVAAALDQRAWTTLFDLKVDLLLRSYTPLLQLIHEGAIFTDFDRFLLTKPAAVLVADSQDILEAAIASEVHQSVDTPSDVSILLVPSGKAAKRALANLELAKDGRDRQARRCRERIRKGKERGLNAFQSLIPQWKGNTSVKIPSKVVSFLVKHIQAEVQRKDFRSAKAIHDDYRALARKKHPDFEPVTAKTYSNWVKKEDSVLREYARGGRRKANAAAPSTNVTDREILASRAFERGCIDHTLLKLFVIVVESNGRAYVRRPWLTNLVDDYSDYWLAFFLSFERPSRRSLAMIFRNCVREYGRVPEFVHSDRGAELRSTYYQGLLAHVGSSPDWNPAANSRFNSQAELINLHIQEKWIAARPGNIIDFDNRRKYSRGFRPQDLATVTLRDAFRELSAYRHIYNDTVIGTREAPPAVLFNQSSEDFGFSGIPTSFDENFIVASSVDTDRDKYKIRPNGDIIRKELHFSHPELRRVRPKKSHVEVREDPENPYRIFCRVEGSWVAALSGGHNVFSTQDAYSRWGESVRVAEGRPVRDFAKSYSGELVADRIRDFNEGESSRLEDNVVQFPTHARGQTEVEEIFESLRSEELEDLESEDSP